MTEYPLTLTEIVSWYREKQRSLSGSPIALVNIRERTEYLPAAGADFDGPNTLGRINGWVSGAFDFEVIRVSDEKDILIRQMEVSAVDQLEVTYAEFLRTMSSGTPTTS